MKRFLTLLMVMAMILAMTTCAAAKEKSYDEKVSFSLNVIYTDRIQDDPRTQFVLDKFNVDIDFIACSASDYVEKCRLWIAGGDMPDIMWSAYCYERTIAGICNGTIPTAGVVSHVFPLEQWAEAFAIADAGKGIKVILKP